MKSRRIISMVVLATTTALALTGCMSVKLDVSVKPDQTAELGYSVSYDKEKLAELLTLNTSVPTPADEPEVPSEPTDAVPTPEGSQKPSLIGVCKTLEDELTSTQVQGDEKLIWSETNESCVATVQAKSFSFDEAGVKDFPFADPITAGVQLKKVDDKVDFTYSPEPFTQSLGVTSEDSWSNLLSDFSLTVSFPGEISSVNHGGTLSEDKHSVSWNLDSLKGSYDDKTGLNAVGGLTPPVAILPFILGGVLLLVLIGGAAAFFAFRRKDGTVKEAVDESDLTATTVNKTV